VRSVFVDASYWIALVNPRDTLHRTAKSMETALGMVRFVTSEMVLTELLNDLARGGESMRRTAVSLVSSLRRLPNVSIVPQTSDQFQDALFLYLSRPDKEWGLTDCASFRIMASAGISEALTHDRHFAQAGFRALLRPSS
jgi:predicted nucleic acid-binding protein